MIIENPWVMYDFLQKRSKTRFSGFLVLNLPARPRTAKNVNRIGFPLILTTNGSSISDQEKRSQPQIKDNVMLPDSVGVCGPSADANTGVG